MNRVTARMTDPTAALQRSEVDVYKLQEQVSTGKRINRASDDPAAAQATLQLNSQLAQNAQYAANIDRTQAWIEAGEGALSSAGDLLNQARELALQMANGSQSAADRLNAADEVKSIRDQLVGIANTRGEDGYVFSGTALTQASFDNTGKFTGSTEQRKIPVADQTNLTLGATGEQAFADPAGTNVFASLNALEQALRNNDVTAISAQADTIETGREQVTTVQTELGLQVTQLTHYQGVLSDSTTALTDRRSAVAEIDPYKALTDLATAQNALNRTLQVSAKTLSTLDLASLL